MAVQHRQAAGHVEAADRDLDPCFAKLTSDIERTGILV